MSGKLDHFEGLRGVCCTIVVVDHSINSFASWMRFNGPDAPMWQKVVANTPLNLTYSGITSVYIFFLMSAFVLSLGYFKYGIDYLPGAALRRYPRLVLPCIGAAVFFYLCVKLAQIFGHDPAGAILPRLIEEAAYGAPLLGSSYFNGPLWTISWEIYGSFLIFAMLAFFGQTRVFGIICLIAALWLLNTNYLPFILGMAACWFFAKNEKVQAIAGNRAMWSMLFTALLGLAAFLMSYPYMRDGVVIPGHLQSISWTGVWQTDYRNNIMAGAFILFLVVCLWQPAQALLSRKSLVWLGKISYSAYLIHLPIIIVVNTIMPRAEHGELAMALLKIAVTLIATAFCAAVFEKYIDRMSVAISSRFSKWALAKHP